MAGKAFWFYLGKLVIPYPLTFIYYRWPVDPHDGWQWLYPAALLALVVVLALGHRRLGRAPLGAVLYYFVGSAALIFLVVLFMTRFTWVSDHWQYLASMSMIALGAAGIVRLARRLRLGALTAGMAVALVPAALGVLTWQRCHIYASEGTVWEDTLAKNNRSSMVQNNYGAWLRDQKRDQEALGHLQRAVELDARNPAALRALGGFYLDHGDYDRAIRYLWDAAQINANLKALQYSLGLAYHHKGTAATSDALFIAMPCASTQRRSIYRPTGRCRASTRRPFRESTPSFCANRPMPRPTPNTVRP